MATYTEPWSSLNALTVSLNSLGSATYVAATAVDISSVDPIDLMIEVVATPGTVSSDKGLYVFLRVSFDGTNYSSGPTSGTTTTDEPNLYQIGFLPLNSNSTLQRGEFSVKKVLGFVPPWFQVVFKNASGASLAGSGNSASYATLTGNA